MAWQKLLVSVSLIYSSLGYYYRKRLYANAYISNILLTQSLGIKNGRTISYGIPKLCFHNGDIQSIYKRSADQNCRIYQSMKIIKIIDFYKIRNIAFY